MAHQLFHFGVSAYASLSLSAGLLSAALRGASWKLLGLSHLNVVAPVVYRLVFLLYRRLAAVLALAQRSFVTLLAATPQSFLPWTPLGVSCCYRFLCQLQL